MPQGNPFTSSNRNRGGSNAITDQKQGGGNKKAGLPYQVGRTQWSSVHLGADCLVTGKCCDLKKLALTKNKNVSISRPIGRNVNMAYWHLPGTGDH
jgi:hypothetical protein